MFKSLYIYNKAVDNVAEFQSYKQGESVRLPADASNIQCIFIAFPTEADRISFKSLLPKSLKCRDMVLTYPGVATYPAIECKQAYKLSKVTGEKNETGDKKMEKFLAALKMFIA